MDVRVDPADENSGTVRVYGDIVHSCLPKAVTLTVISGSGDGTYAPGQVVNILADPPPAGSVFAVWAGDNATVAAVTAPSTTITMLMTDATVTAVYRSTTATSDDFIVVMNPDNTPDPDSNSSGWNDGAWLPYPQPNGPTWWNTWFYDDPPDPFRWKKIEYDISIQPLATGVSNYIEVALNWSTVDFPESDPNGPPPQGGEEQFIEREILHAGLVSDLIRLTGQHIIWDYNPEWVSMDVRVDPQTPNSEQIIVQGQIWHECLPKWVNLTVINGVTTGLYPAGSVQPISAGPPPAATMIFVKWTGDTAGVADITAPNTTITLGLVDVTVRAKHRWPGDLNDDGVDNIVDLNMVLIDWGKTGGFADARSDADGSGAVDIVDLNTVLIDWGKTSPP
ncbi:hypothetical protein LCGC14_2400740, partial [marine sediment metagenome]